MSSLLAIFLRQIINLGFTTPEVEGSSTSSTVKSFTSSAVEGSSSSSTVKGSTRSAVPLQQTLN